MALAEEDAAKIVLIRSIEECDRSFFSDAHLADAVAAAKDAPPGLRWVLARAQCLFEGLSSAYQSVLHLIRLPTPFTLPLCVIALVVGFATNLLGPADRIHVVRNPVLLLVVWNLFVYLVLFLVFVARPRRRRPPPAPPAELVRAQPRAAVSQGSVPDAALSLPSLARFLMPGLWHLVHRAALGIGEKKKLADGVRRFSVNWYAVAAPLVASRWEVMLHVGALCLAIGAVAGMYFQGLFRGYQAIWSSTFITSEASVGAFVHLLFGPSLLVSDLLDLGLADAIDVGRLLSPGGDKAAAWIHLFAITVLITIVIPRGVLAAWQWRNVER